LPEGWVEITADGEDYQAKFAKVAVNVLQRLDGEENVLPELMRRWFGEAAGQPGTSQFVEFSRSGGRYVLAPHQGETTDGPRLGASYPRVDVPKLFGFEFGGFESQLGVVERDKLTLLFVTLDKSQKPEEHRYEDAFLSPEEFRWQSQNRTSRESEAGRRISEHAKRGIGVHLFVRAQAKTRGVTQRFTYCGRLEFERWEADRPITVWWRLQTRLPENLWTSFRATGAGKVIAPSDESDR
jgi:hypothetical protein